MYYCCGVTDIGTTRTRNEDAFLINRIVMNRAQMESSLSLPFLTAVADGVAGENSGEIASRLSLEMLGQVEFSEKTNLSLELLHIHDILRQYGLSHAGTSNMQTTICALGVDEKGQVYSVNVGDSRLYRMRGGILSQLTKDQSLVQLMYDKGQISAPQMRTHAQKHVILPVIGNLASSPDPETKTLGEFLPGDLFLLCTDGFYDRLNLSEMAEFLSRDLPLAKRLSLMVELAKRKGSKDNITAVAVSGREE